MVSKNVSKGDAFSGSLNRPSNIEGPLGDPAWSSSGKLRTSSGYPDTVQLPSKILLLCLTGLRIPSKRRIYWLVLIMGKSKSLFLDDGTFILIKIKHKVSVIIRFVFRQGRYPCIYLKGVSSEINSHINFNLKYNLTSDTNTIAKRRTYW